MKLSLKARITGGIGIILVLLLASGGFGWTLMNQIDGGVANLSQSLEQRRDAQNIDLLMQKVRVRVNQWLRSMNPAFAKQADELLADVTAKLSADQAGAASEERKAAAGQTDVALQAYTVSWHAIQQMYADENKLYDTEIASRGPKLYEVLAKLRQNAAVAADVSLRDLIDQATDSALLARVSSARFRSLGGDAIAKSAEDALTAAMAAVVKAKAIAKDAAVGAGLDEASAQLSAYRDDFHKIVEINKTRIARLGSWTQEGEAMTVGSDRLQVVAEKKAAEARRLLGNSVGDSATMLLVSTGIIVGLSLLLGFYLVRSSVTPVTRLTAATKAVASGNLAADIPGVERHDEIGDMAKAIEVFKQGIVEKERLQVEQRKSEAEQRERAEALRRQEEARLREEEAREQRVAEGARQVEEQRRLNGEAHDRATQEQRKREMLALADGFEASVKGIVHTVASASTEMESTASGMSATAEETSRQATAVAAASEQASANVQTVASAAEELSSSIGEISRQVTQSNKIASKAVDEASRTNATVQMLSEAAQKIGQVVELISSIAGQTNLLALNATIEAARAGESGKGFAVVASEVKSLANQTAKATEDIGQQIANMQQISSDAVAAIQGISSTIVEINEIAVAIASAIEEQGAATQEIARNVQQAAAGTQEVSSNVSNVTRAASDTGAAATQVLSSASELSKQSEMLQAEVDTFLAKVRAA